MKPRHRRTFFLGALFLFTVIAPVLILGASGYRYDFKGQVLVPTGTLVLKSYPEGAKILIDLQERPHRTPAEIQGLLPSRYTLEVRSEDFRPWRKEVEIQANRITVEDRILLIPKRIALSSASEREIRTFAVSPDGRSVIYVPRKKNGERESLRHLNLISGEERLLFSLGSDQSGALSAEDSIERLLWLAEGGGVAFSVATLRSKRYFILAMEGDEAGAPFEWVPPVPGEADRWKPEAGGFGLFFMQAESLYRADYRKRSIERVVPDRVRGYTLSDNFLYFVTVSPSLLFRLDLMTGERAVLAELPTEPAEGSRPEHLALSSRGKIALIDRHRILWLIDGVPAAAALPVAAEVQAALFNEDGRRLLYQTERGLFVYHLEEGKSFGGREAGSFETVVRREGPVVHPAWYSDQFHILYGAGDTVYLTETGGPGPPIADPLFRIPGEASRFVYQDDRVTFLFRNRLYHADLSFGRSRSAFLGSRL